MSLFNNILANKRCTLFCAGPMSKNCVDAAIEISSQYSVPIVLIASRRQIEARELGCGYVNNWSTEEFAKYVRSNSKNAQIYLARDHGGPWQNNRDLEDKISFREAMDSAKFSFKTDIDAGFDLLHIDPSIDISNPISTSAILDRVFELYEFCSNTAQKLNRNIDFEIGTEEQAVELQDLSELDYVLRSTFSFCDINMFQRPKFIVAQTGTKVMETQNTGLFDHSVQNDRRFKEHILNIVDICRKNNIFLKEHNADYLSNAALQYHVELGIHAANVAPEFGVIETGAFLSILNTNSLDHLAEKFINLAYNSGQWTKWMMPNTNKGYFEKGIIAGHYVFATNEFIEIKKEAQAVLKGSGLEIDAYLKGNIKSGMLRYLEHFNLIPE